MTLLPANPTHSSYQSIVGELSQFFTNIRAWDYPKIQNRAFRRSAGALCFFRCGCSPDLLAALQGNPGQPTPFFASVATLAVLALPLIIALTRTFVLVIIRLKD